MRMAESRDSRKLAARGDRLTEPDPLIGPRDIASVLAHWVKMFGLNPGGRYVDRAIQNAVALTPNTIRGLGVGSFLYAGLFLTEGIGLWLLKRWAQWFTVIMTSSLIPLAIYEIDRHPTALKVLVLIINVAVVGFLVHRIQADASA